MTVDDLKHLHPSDVVLWLHVETAVRRLVDASNARVHSIRPTPLHKIDAGGGKTLYGRCHYFRYPRPGMCNLEFTLRGRRGGKFDRQRLPMWSLMDTVAHEVAHAHVKWADEHNAKFFRAFGRMILLSEKLKLRLDIEKSGVKLPE